MNKGSRLLELLGLGGLALLLQLFCHTYLPEGFYPDVVLILVVCLGWYEGPVTGALCGSVLGLSQDAVEILPLLGLNGITKTLAGFAAGYLSRWVFLDGLAARVLMLALFSLSNGLLIRGLTLILTESSAGPELAPLLGTATLTALTGAAFFRAYESIKLPAKDFRQR